MPFIREEWEAMLRHYMPITIDAEIAFQFYIACRKNTVLGDWVRYLFDHAAEAGPRRGYFKQMVVGLFGKFLTDPNGSRVLYGVNEQGEPVRVEEDVMKKTVYMPLGMWIQSCVRTRMLNIIAEIPPKYFLYCDTD